MFRKIVIFSLLALLFSSCIKQDLSDCVLRFEFSYTYNKANEERLSHIRDIRIYIFDNNSRLYEIMRVSQQDITKGSIEHFLPSGNYTAVAWGAGSKDKVQGGYKGVQMLNPATHVCTDVNVGVTTLNNFYLTLSSVALPTDIMGDIIPENEQFDDLFYAIAQNISVTEGRRQTIQLGFMKNTSNLNIKVTGLQNITSRSTSRSEADISARAADQPLDVFVIAPNERYSYDNQIDSYSRNMRYERPYSDLSADEMSFNKKMQRLVIGTPVKLYIQDPATGLSMFSNESIDVVDAILSARDASGNLVWESQAAIDREDEFSIEVSILHDLSVSIIINEFEIIEPGPNLRP
jgi:hypothetical protein